MIIVFVVLAIIGFFILRALYVYASIPVFARSWNKANAKPVDSNSIVIVALGDSTVQGLGALTPQLGFVGRVADQVSQQTGKSVQVHNFSRSGAESGEVVKDQLPKIKKLSRYDVVLVAVGPNDITHKKSLKDFEENTNKIIAELPAQKIVISNMPPMQPKDIDGNTSYIWGTKIMEIAKAKGVKTAPVYERVQTRVNDKRIYAGDFYHPSGAGYKLWTEAFTPEVLDIVQK